MLSIRFSPTTATSGRPRTVLRLPPTVTSESAHMSNDASTHNSPLLAGLVTQEQYHRSPLQTSEKALSYRDEYNDFVCLRCHEYSFFF